MQVQLLIIAPGTVDHAVAEQLWDSAQCMARTWSCTEERASCCRPGVVFCPSFCSPYSSKACSSDCRAVLVVAMTEPEHRQNSCLLRTPRWQRGVRETVGWCVMRTIEKH
jgi:hypothetical protein